MMRCIITPTYQAHFIYVKKYLESFNLYLKDRDFPIYFIINQKEAEDFREITAPYETDLNIKVLYLDDIFQCFNIQETPEEALKKYGRLSFQTLKKLYSALFIGAEQFLFLDSESMLISETNMEDLFNEYFQLPTFFVSRIADRPKQFKNTFVYGYLKTVTNILGSKPLYWSVESYCWFYELRILNDLIQEFGSPIEIIRSYKMENRFPGLEGVLEALLYYQYILLRNEKYQYHIEITQDVFKQYLGEKDYNDFIRNFDSDEIWLGGLVEQFPRHLKKENVNQFIKFVRDFKLSVIRLEAPPHNYFVEKYFINEASPHILASSQQHLFGVNAPKPIPKMKYAIITPTFRDHFQFINKYLESFNHYVVDKKEIAVVFTISASEYNAFLELITPYKKTCNIYIIIFEDLLIKNHIFNPPEGLLHKHGKFSYQTLKKYYTMLAIDAEKFLVLDSETMWIRSTNQIQLFETFFDNPFLLGTEFRGRENMIDRFTLDEIDNINYILQFKTDLWLLEAFAWFYDKKILQDLFAEVGSPIDVVEHIHPITVHQYQMPGIFEILLYQTFIYKYHEKYCYRVFNLSDIVKSNLGEEIYQKILQNHFAIGHGGFGVFERILEILNPKNIDFLANFYRKNHINILRGDCLLGNYKLQKKFIKIAEPNILAAAQYHFFGLNKGFGKSFGYFWRSWKHKLREKTKQVLRKVSPSYKVSSEIRDHINFMDSAMHNRFNHTEAMIFHEMKRSKNGLPNVLSDSCEMEQAKLYKEIIKAFPKGYFQGKEILLWDCGYGEFGLLLMSLGASVTFTDRRQECCEIVSKKLPERNKIFYPEEANDFWKTGLDKKFDLVVHMGINYYDDNPFIREIMDAANQLTVIVLIRIVDGVKYILNTNDFINFHPNPFESKTDYLMEETFLSRLEQERAWTVCGGDKFYWDHQIDSEGNALYKSLLILKKMENIL